MKQWIRFAFLGLTLTSVCVVTAQVKTGDVAYELKGETPGTTTLKQFKKNHRHPDCTAHTERQTTCWVYEGVSFAGQTSHNFKGCTDLLNCGGQGINAQFVDDVMVSLTYGVMEGPDILPALRSKYGEPTMTKGAYSEWKNSVGTLSIGTSGLTTSITSSLNDKGAKRDI
jgi:hypothetical protein